jgi:hypothetical protein
LNTSGVCIEILAMIQIDDAATRRDSCAHIDDQIFHQVQRWHPPTCKTNLSPKSWQYFTCSQPLLPYQVQRILIVGEWYERLIDALLLVYVLLILKHK